MVERYVDYIGESKNKAGFSIVEVVTDIDGSSIVDVYHVKTSNITPNGQKIVWGHRKNGTFYIKRIEA